MDRSLKWMQDLQQGDKVFVYWSYSSDWKVETVERTTPTLIFIKDHKFNKKTGYEPNSKGSTFRSRASLAEWTQEKETAKLSQKEKELHQHQLVDKLRSVEWKWMSLAKLEKIVAILDIAEEAK
jgi:hypothetical protein